MYSYQELPFEDNEIYLVLYKDHEFAGALKVRNNATLKCKEVTEVAAKSKSQGIGTELYKLAFAVYGSICPCRIPGEVRPGAEAIWNSFYSGKFKNSVTQVPIHDGRHQNKPALNTRYSSDQFALPAKEPLKEGELELDVIDRADKFLFNEIGFSV